MTYRLKALLLTFSLFCFSIFTNAQNNDFGNTASTTQNTVCENTAVGFTPIPIGFDTGFGAIDSVRWNFGDNPDWQIDQLPYGIGYVYTTAGVYTVTAVVYYASGVVDSIIKTNLITVNANPVISFATTPNSGCQPLDVQFNPSTTSASTTGWTWTWTFSSDSICFAGDLRDTIIRTNVNSFSNTFTEDGIYDVKLLVENQLGCRSDTTAFNVFTVEPTPTASFTTQIQPDCDSTTSVVFTSTSSLPCTPSPMYNWNFGDGIGSITTASPTHTYEYLTSGTFTIQLIVTDGTPNGCADTTSQTITIDADPTVSIQAPNTACATDSIQFNGISSGMVTSWMWDFGDGNTSSEKSPAHQYIDAGTGKYQVCVSVLNPLTGCRDTLCDSLEIVVTSILPIQKSTLRVAPNPVEDRVNVTFWNNDTGEQELTVMDVFGRIVKKKLVQSQPGENQISLSFTGLSKGIYWLQLTDGQSIKLIRN